MEINKFVDFIEGQITGVHLEVLKLLIFQQTNQRMVRKVINT